MRLKGAAVACDVLPWHRTQYRTVFGKKFTAFSRLIQKRVKQNAEYKRQDQNVRSTMHGQQRHSTFDESGKGESFSCIAVARFDSTSISQWPCLPHESTSPRELLHAHFLRFHRLRLGVTILLTTIRGRFAGGSLHLRAFFLLLDFTTDFLLLPISRLTL